MKTILLSLALAFSALAQTNTIEIKDRWTGQVIYAGRHDNLRKAVEYCASKGLPLRNADLKGQDLTDLFLDGLDLSGADISGAFLAGSSINGVQLVGTLAKATDFARCDARNVMAVALIADGADFEAADLRGWISTTSSLKQAIFDTAKLDEANLAGADLTGAFVANASMPDVHVTGSTVLDDRSAVEAKIAADTQAKHTKVGEEVLEEAEPINP